MKSERIKEIFKFLSKNCFSILFIVFTVIYYLAIKDQHLTIKPYWKYSVLCLYGIIAAISILTLVYQHRNDSDLKSYHNAFNMAKDAHAVGFFGGLCDDEFVEHAVRGFIIKGLRKKLETEIISAINSFDENIETIKSIEQIVIFHHEILLNWDIFDGIPVGFYAYICNRESASVEKLSSVPSINNGEPFSFRVFVDDDSIKEKYNFAMNAKDYVIYITESNAIHQINSIKLKVKEEIEKDYTKSNSFIPPICVFVSGKLTRETLTEEHWTWYDTKWRDVEVLTIKDCKITLKQRYYV